MSKRFATIFFISITVVLLLVVVFFLILILAPGVSILGLRYIATGARPYEDNGEKVVINQLAGGVTFTTIEVNTYEVPIYVIFTESWNYEVEYYDSFNGLTTSSNEYPDCVITSTATSIVIDVSEFHKVVYETSSSERYLNIYIPLASVQQGNTDQYSLNLVINSTKSNVYFSKADKTDEAVPTFNTINITTNGKVSYGTTILATTYKLSTSYSISISEDFSNFITATNYDLTSTSGKITIYPAVSGDLTVSTKNGKIKLLSCRNLYATTTYGSISSSGSSRISVEGIVQITTKAGNVTLGDIKGVGTNTITTSSGKVDITSIGDGTITTKRGSVTISQLENFVISTDVGNVTVEEVSEAIDVSTKRGKIVLGTDSTYVNNVTAFSRLGNITVVSAKGEADIETVSSNVSFKNTSCTLIDISAGKKLSAYNLSGTINIYANGESYIEFSKIDGASEFEFGSSCKKVTIYALENTKENTGLKLTASNIVIMEQKNNAYINVDGNNSLKTSYEKNTTLSNYLLLSANSATVTLYLLAAS